MWFAMWSSTSASYLDDLTADAQSKKSSKKKAAEECVLKLLHGGVTMGLVPQQLRRQNVAHNARSLHLSELS